MIQRSDVARLSVPLPLASGRLLVDGEIAYETSGVVNPKVALVWLHDLQHSHLAFGDPPTGGWGKKLFGPEQPLTPAHGFWVSLNLLGSPFGSTSAAKFAAEASTTAFPIGLEDMARAAASALRGLGIERALSVGGFGLGGMVALKMAALFPELVSSVMVLGTASQLPNRPAELLAKMGQRIEAGEFAQAHAELLALDNVTAPEEVEAFTQSFHAASYASLGRAYAQADLRLALKEVRCPALLVSSQLDPFAPQARVRDAYHALIAAGSAARLYELPEDGHHALWEKADRLKGPLREFLSGVPHPP